MYTQLMMIIYHHSIVEAKPCPVAGGLWVWGDMGQNRKDELVWEFENCENRIEELVFDRKDHRKSSY